MEISIVDTTADHVIALKSTMRDADRREAEILGISPERALWRSWKSSLFSKAGLIDGEVAAIWGVRGTPMGIIGTPWLITGKAIEKISPLKFTRIYQKQVDEMINIFPELVNYVDSSYTKAIRMLENIGFKLEDPVPVGATGALYRRFTMKSEG